MTKKDVKQRLENGEDPLDLSIEKWESICETDDIDTAIGLDEGGDNCALCHVYFLYRVYSPENCVGCPVYKAANQQYCRGTPHSSWVYKVMEYNRIAQEDVYNRTKLGGQIKAVAAAELEFLRSLK